MAFGMKTQLIGFAEEVSPGTYNSAVETNRPKVRFQTGATVDISAEFDEDTDFLSGDWGGNEISVAGARLAKVMTPMKLTATEIVNTMTGEFKFTYAGLLKACGLANVSNASKTQFFFPSRFQASKTLSFIRWITENSGGINGKTHRECVKGAVGTFSIDVAGRGKPFIFNPEFSGVVQKVDDVVTNTCPLFDDESAMSIIPDAFLSTTITLKNIVTSVETTHCVSTLNFTSNNVVSEVECQSSPSGVQSYFISDIAPALALDPLLRSMVEFDSWGSMVDGTLYEVTISSPKISIYIPRAQILEAPITDSNGLARTAIKFKPLRNIYKDLPNGLLEADMTGFTIEEAMYFICMEGKESDY